MKIVSPKVMSEIDKQTIDNFKIPGSLLMENAGIKCWLCTEQFIEKNNLTNTNIVILAGSGNNGGDALVFARHSWISGIKNISIIFLKNTGSELFMLHKKICENLKIPILNYSEEKEVASKVISESGLIIDGLTGTGLLGPLRSNTAELVKLANLSTGKKISIDIPSGLGEIYKEDYPVIKADLTLTIGLPKTTLYYPDLRSFSGEIRVVDMGFPPSLLDNPSDAGDIYYNNELKLPKIDNWAHKGTRGHTAVFAGSVGTVGAAVLSSSAAGRSRSGLVTLFADRNIYTELASSLISVMVKKIDPEILEIPLEGVTSILAGPGWGINSRENLLKQLFESNIPGVLDADGLNILTKIKTVIENNPGYLKGQWVFTPHPGEYARFTGIDKNKFLISPLSYLRNTAAEYGAVIVLKGHVTFIVTPSGDYTIVDGMNPSLATGGSGDVLAGIIAGLLAQGLSPYTAAVAGVTIHQKIGKLCFKEKGWFLAEDLLSYISMAVKEMEIL